MVSRVWVWLVAVRTVVIIINYSSPTHCINLHSPSHLPSSHHPFDRNPHLPSLTYPPSHTLPYIHHLVISLILLHTPFINPTLTHHIHVHTCIIIQSLPPLLPPLTLPQSLPITLYHCCFQERDSIVKEKASLQVSVVMVTCSRRRAPCCPPGDGSG